MYKYIVSTIQNEIILFCDDLILNKIMKDVKTNPDK